MATPLENRSFVGRYFALSFDNQSDAPGYLKSIEGGSIKGELLAQQIGGQPFRIKHVNNPMVEPVTVQVPLSMSDDLFEWVRKSWRGEVERRSGSITSYDFNHKPVHEWGFQEALILETTVPALDAQSRDPGYITVKFQAETAEHKYEPGGSKIQVKAPPSQTKWLHSNFRLELGSLDCTRIHKIDAFTVKQNAKPMACGSDWMYQIEPTSLEYPNLTVYVSMISAKTWFDWHKEFVVMGKNKPENELTGSITFLDSTLKEELLTINLMSVGIVNITAEKSDASGQDQVKRAKVELYVEEMEILKPAS
jgi:hypothetical protein